MEAKASSVLSGFEAAISAICKHNDVIPAQQIRVLLAVALSPGLTVRQLQDRTGLSQSSCSRNLMALGDWHRAGKPGQEFVESIDDPHERRRRIVFLTTKGEALIEEIIFSLSGRHLPFNTQRASDYIQKAHATAQARRANAEARSRR